MDLNDIVSMGTELFNNKLGDTAEGIDNSVISDALSGLLSNEEGGLDLGNIMSALTGDSEGGLASIVSSWIGSGENEAIDGSTLTNLLGSDAISGFAEKLEQVTRVKLSGSADIANQPAGLQDCITVLTQSYRFGATAGIGELSRAVGKYCSRWPKMNLSSSDVTESSEASSKL